MNDNIIESHGYTLDKDEPPDVTYHANWRGGYVTKAMAAARKLDEAEKKNHKRNLRFRPTPAEVKAVSLK